MNRLDIINIYNDLMNNISLTPNEKDYQKFNDLLSKLYFAEIIDLKNEITLFHNSKNYEDIKNRLNQNDILSEMPDSVFSLLLIGSIIKLTKIKPSSCIELFQKFNLKFKSLLIG